MAVNLRRLYLNMQSPADNVGQRALDAIKAFNSIEWEYLWGILQRFGFGEAYISWLSIAARRQLSEHQVVCPTPLPWAGA